jgi:hypothetical protein
MRALLVLVVSALSMTSVSLTGLQDGADEKPRVPKRGDTIVAKGCLRGSMLESTELGLADGQDRAPAGHTFQIKGKKDLLKRLRERHDGHVVEITGLLKSNLTDASQRGTRVGNTRIVIGVESTSRGAAVPGTMEALPVLEAKSFVGSEASCRR